MSDPEMPPLWSVPREWVGERCFIIAGGESVRTQREAIKALRGRIIAIKQSVFLRPDADVLFLAGESSIGDLHECWKAFTGTHLVVRGWRAGQIPPGAKMVTRTKDHEHLSELQDHVCGYDVGTSAIDLAYHFGATEIILLGYDMTGGRWFNGELAHSMPFPPEQHFQRHMGPLPALAADAKAKGIRIVNCSPISRVKCFEKQPLGAFL